MSAVFGIDFGTSNSALAVARQGQVEMLNLDPENPISNSLKSILYFLKEDGETRTFVGYEGVAQYIANGADGRYMQSIKSFLPDTGFDKTSIYGTTYTLEELIAVFLKTMKERGEALIGQTVDQVVLGRPVIFSEDPEREKTAQDRLHRAAGLAGFKHIDFQLEPIAAALAYEQGLPERSEEIVLVGDFGAGSSDFTIHRAGRHRGAANSGSGRDADIIASGGVYIGGDNFDGRIMRERIAAHYGKDVTVKSMFSDNETGLSPLVIRRLMQWHKIPQLRLPRTLNNIRELKVNAGFNDKKLLENLENLINNNYGYLLFRAIESAKCDLSDRDSTRAVFKDYGMAINETILRVEFQEMIRDEAARIGTCIDNTLKEAGLRPADIDVVFLTGGSSYIPLIRSLFDTRIGADKIRTADAFT
ncbi:MAG TPA: Hsp70 family protein, partial [Desulfobacteraceae bacterium]|nr:Hsp70 family protein [Desulfobacteraceae bacterium]